MMDYNWPSGTERRVKRHTTLHSPVGLWQFDDFATFGADSSGNGLTLAVETGTSRPTQIYPGVTGVLFDGSTSWWRSAATAALAITGDMTFECLFLLYTAAPAGAYFFSHTAPGDLEADNQLYGLQISLATPNIRWFQENGAGNDNFATPANYYMGIDQLCHMAVTRSGLTITAYLNGQAWGSAAVANAATGGGSGRFRLGADAATRIPGVMASAKLIASALTADQVKAEYNYTLGGVFGQIP